MLAERESPSSTARAKIASARSGVALQQIRHPSAWSIVARYGLAGLSPSQGELGVAAHLRHAVAAQQGAQVGERGPPSCSRRPACRWRSPRSAAAAQRSVSPDGRRGEDQRPVHGDRRVALDQFVRLEPLHPAQHGVGAPARPHGVGELQDEAGDPVGVAGGLGVVDGDLGLAVRLVPRRRPAVQVAATISGSRRRSSDMQQLSEQRGGSGTTRADGRAGRPAGCGAPAARARGPIRSSRPSASQSGPHMRSRIDVRVRKVPRRSTPGRGAPSAGSRP